MDADRVPLRAFQLLRRDRIVPLLFTAAIDVLHDHNGIIHYDPDGEHQCKKREEIDRISKKIQEKELEQSANSLVGELTRDNKRADLLRKEALQYAKYTETGVVYEIGGVAVDAAKLKEKLASDYPFLVDGSGASGGGAQGGSRDGKAGKWADYTPAQLSEIRQSDPAQYEHLKTTR